MNTKRKGSVNERKSRDIFRSMGYTCIKAGASLGVWDIVAIGRCDFILCQVKTNGWPNRVEMNRIKRFECPHNATKIIHRWDDRSHEPKVMYVK